MGLPPCFGVYWDGTEGSSCIECEIKDDCLAKFVRTTLLQWQQKLGERATPELLSEVTGINAAAIKLAENVQRNLGLAKSLPPQPEEEKTCIPEIETVDDQSVTDPGETSMGARKKEKATTEAPKKKARRGRPPKAKSATVEKVKTKVKAKAKPKATKKRAKAKPKVKPEVTLETIEPEVIDRPTMARTIAKPAKVLAKPKRGKSATSVSEQAGARRTWSTKHDKARFERELARNPELRHLKPGYLLDREWPPKSGIWVEAKVLHYRYKWNNQEFPTLYSLTKAITGTTECPKQKRPDGLRPEGTRQLAPWSPIRFWKRSLEKYGCFQAAREAAQVEEKSKKRKVKAKRPPPTKSQVTSTTLQLGS